jgi:hypothetical protein
MSFRVSPDLPVSGEMDLRDWFAGQVLPKAISDWSVSGPALADSWLDPDANDTRCCIANIAYDMADTMIKTKLARSNVSDK